MSHARLRIAGALVAALAMCGGWLIRAQDETRAGEWRSSGGDSTYKRYSPLAQITRDNVKNLRVVWRRPALDPALKGQFPKLRTNNYLRATPTMIGGVLYAPDATGLVQAFDAATGAADLASGGRPDMADEASASSTRGVDFWKGGSDHRLFNVRNGYLYALDLRGRATRAFGNRRSRAICCRRALTASAGPPARSSSATWSSSPAIWTAPATAARSGRTLRRRTCAGSTHVAASCCGRSTSCRATASSAPTPGATSRGSAVGRSRRRGTRMIGRRTARLRLHPADGADRVVLTAAGGPATISSRTRWSRSTRRPASASGTSR